MRHPLDRDLSNGQRYPSFEQLTVGPRTNRSWVSSYRKIGNYRELRPITQVKLRNLGGLFSQLLSANRSCMREEEENSRHVHIYKGWNIFIINFHPSFFSPHYSLNTRCADVMAYDHRTAFPEHMFPVA